MFLSSEKIINLLWTKFPYAKKVGRNIKFCIRLTSSEKFCWFKLCDSNALISQGYLRCQNDSLDLVLAILAMPVAKHGLVPFSSCPSCWYNWFSDRTTIRSVQFSCSVVSWPFATSWTAAHQASLSITNSQSLLKLMSIESVIPSNHLTLCRPLLLPPSIFPSIRVFSNESVLRIRWPKYWSFSLSISLSNEHSGPIFFRMDWLDLLAVQGTLKSFLQHHSSKASILWRSATRLIYFTVLSRVQLCNHMDYSLPGSSIHGILQARLLEWFTISYSRGSSRPRDWTHISFVSCIGRWIFLFFNHWASWQAQTKTLHLLNTRAEYLHARSCLNVLISS